MRSIAKVTTAHDYFKTWISRLSDTQAQNFENVKNACDALEKHGGNRALNPSTVGKYCQDPGTGTGDVPPAPQTIRNMRVTFEGVTVHVYRDYIKKREHERKKPQTKRTQLKEHQPTYVDLAMQIKDDDTRSWVLDLVQRWAQAENSCDFLEKQLQKMSKQVGGLDIVAAITEGPDERLNLPMMASKMPGTIEFTTELRDALEGILSIPNNSHLPFIRLNDQGALVYDEGASGAVIILSPKKWQAIVEAVKGAKA